MSDNNSPFLHVAAIYKTIYIIGLITGLFFMARLGFQYPTTFAIIGIVFGAVTCLIYWFFSTVFSAMMHPGLKK